MCVKSIYLSNFMLFQNLDMDFSKNINVISGENSTGKTALLKIIYSNLKAISELNKSRSIVTKEKFEEVLVNKLQGVFRPDENYIGRLVGRKQGTGKTEVRIAIGEKNINFEFSSRQEKHVTIKNGERLRLRKFTPIYIPPKEIISAVENFSALYEEYHIAFEETYYDLAKLLQKPLRKGPNTREQVVILEKFEEIMEGKIIQKDSKFFLRVDGSGEFEMGLVSEGYRKLSTIMYLILSGSLGKNSVLFWDEPETNMNPKMIPALVAAIIELAKMGVQVFVTTHDYFVQQEFNLFAEYQKEKVVDVRFVSLYKDEGIVKAEIADRLAGLSHNSITEEFENLYNKEQRLFYDVD